MKLTSASSCLMQNKVPYMGPEAAEINMLRLASAHSAES